MQKQVSGDVSSDEARKGGLNTAIDVSLAMLGDGSKSSAPDSELISRIVGSPSVSSNTPYPIIGPHRRPEIFGFMRAVQFIEQFFPDASQKNVFRGGVCDMIFRLKVNVVRYSACILYMFSFPAFSAFVSPLARHGSFGPSSSYFLS